MEEKQNDKPIEMPSRGRPRKKDHLLDPVFNNEPYNYETTEETNGYSIEDMRPYSSREDNEILEQFNSIGEVIRRRDERRDDKHNLVDNRYGDERFHHQRMFEPRFNDLRQYDPRMNGQRFNDLRVGPRINDPRLNALRVGPRLNDPRLNSHILSEQRYHEERYHEQRPNQMPFNEQRPNQMPFNEQRPNQMPFNEQRLNESILNEQRPKESILNEHRFNDTGSSDQQIPSRPSPNDPKLDRLPDQYDPKLNDSNLYIDHDLKNNDDIFADDFSQINPVHVQSNNPFSHDSTQSFFTKSRPVLNISNFYKSPHRPSYKLPDDFDSSWMYKKKRKSNPVLWQYINQSQDDFKSLIHPSKYSSLDYIQGSDVLNRDFNNSILPLFLNSSKEMNDEYKMIISNFKRRVSELDFSNVTVHQLKLLMREFGLNHTGKKNELIERAKQTIKKIESTSKEMSKKKSKEKEEEDEVYNNVFF
ncbi:uncharacterized protein VNE69_02164 [Vairimorpha necatrix]|uniref:SAP domain-containing protein n=1 Tax=Vairimorpha necatrix TaxID=6039 RepID=A0AAX4J9Q3_9MICR